MNVGLRRTPDARGEQRRRRLTAVFTVAAMTAGMLGAAAAPGLARTTTTPTLSIFVEPGINSNQFSQAAAGSQVTVEVQENTAQSPADKITLTAADGSTNDTVVAMDPNSNVRNTNPGAGYTDSNGFTYFSVTLQGHNSDGSGSVTLTASDATNAAVTSVSKTVPVVADTGGVVAGTTITKSAGRVEPGPGGVTLTVHVPGAAGQTVYLAATPDDPHPPAAPLYTVTNPDPGPYGSGFAGMDFGYTNLPLSLANGTAIQSDPSNGAPLHGGIPNTSAVTDAQGNAVFQVIAPIASGGPSTTPTMAYFTPIVQVSSTALALTDATAAVIFADAPNAEATNSNLQLNDPDPTGSVTPLYQVNAPADGVTPVSVWVRLMCNCEPFNGSQFTVSSPGGSGNSVTTNYQGSYKDASDGNGGWVAMPMPTETYGGGSLGSHRALRGALTQLVPGSAGTHAVITPVYDTTNLDASNDPLSYYNPTGSAPVPSEAYQGGTSDQNAGEPYATDYSVAVFQVTDSVAEQVTLGAFDATNNVTITGNSSASPATGSVTINFQPTLPSVAHTTVSAAPGSVPADGTTTSQITVVEQDAQGRPISGRTVELTPSTGSNASLSTSSGTTDLTGSVKFTVTDSTVENITFSAYDQQSGLLGTTTVDFTVAPPSLTNSSVSASPNSVPADGTSTSTVTVSLANGAGAPVSGATVSLSQGSGSSTISPATATTNTSGVATFTVSDAKAETIYYIATVGTGGNSFQLPDTNAVTFTPGAISTSQSALVANPTSVPADGSTPITLTVTLLDSQRNPISGKTVSIAPGGSATITAVNGTTTAADGTVSFTATDTTAEQLTFTATDTTDSKALTPVTVTFSGPAVAACPSASNPAHCSSVSASATSAAVNSLVTVTAIARDTNGFPVSGQQLALTTSGGGYQTAQSPTGGITGGNGTVSFLVSSSAAGQVAFSVVDGTTLLGSAAVTFFGAPAGTHSTIAVNQSVVPADGMSTATITVTVEDVNANPVSGQNVTLSANSTSTTIAPATTQASNANGVVTFTVSDNQVEQVSYTATAGSVTTSPVSVTYTQPNTEAGNSTVSATPTSGIAANGVAASTVTVTLKSPGNTALQGDTVSLNCPGGTVAPVSGTSSSSAGIVAFTVTATTAGPVLCTATDTSATPQVRLDQTPQITFITPPSEANQSTVAAAPTVVPDNGTTTSTIVVVLRAADGSPLNNHQVSLAAGGGSSAIQPAPPTLVNTDSTGTATFTVSDSTAEPVTYTATDTTAPATTIGQTATVTFTDEASASTAVAAPASVPADGHATSSIVVTLISAGHPVVGHHVTLVPQGGVSKIHVVTETTGQDGKAVFKVRDKVAEVVRYQIIDTTLGLTLSALPQVTFRGTGPAPTVDWMDPNEGPAGTVVTIHGTNLAKAAVSFGGVPAETVTVNPEGTEVKATAPGGSGTVHVTIATSGGHVIAGDFTYGPRRTRHPHDDQR